jgi:two-component system, sensor histidine kinase and response regulator
MHRILIVDDEESVRKFLIDTLRFAGYDTISAADGAIGLKMAEQTLPDLIISDINMPHMDGYAMMEELRNFPQTSIIPIILLTIEDGYQSIRRGMVRGADDYLPKPVSPGDVLAAVQTQLQKRAMIADKHDTNLHVLRRNIVYALPHELRTPLSIIMGYAELLQMGYKTTSADDVLELSQSILSAGQRLQRLVENYLVYAQLEVIFSDPDERQAARNHLVKDASAIIAAAARGKAESHSRLNDLKLDVSGKSLQISQDNLNKIVSEVADNAFKFSRPDTPVEIQTVEKDKTFMISIHDYGRGMNAEQVKLVGAYMQFGRALFEQQGIGLGLVIAQRLAHLHDGVFTIDSQPNDGTLVTIRFPTY